MALLCETERLIVRHFELSDSDFIIQLLNQASFIRYIADKNVRTTEDAIQYLTNGPIASYQHYGFGLSMVALKACGTPVGMCGVLKRPELEHPDLGYAFWSRFWPSLYQTTKPPMGYCKNSALANLAPKNSMVWRIICTPFHLIPLRKVEGLTTCLWPSDLLVLPRNKDHNYLTFIRKHTSVIHI